MIFRELKLKGAYLIEPEMRADERGFFARTFCQEEFYKLNLNPQVAQCSVSFNAKKGTLRGMHFQSPPKMEVKVVRVTRGAAYDVIVDLRVGSPTCRQWFAAELSAENHHALYIPKGFAHGFQTLEDNTEIYYQMSEFYAPECSRGVRWDDPVLKIDWPPGPRIISPRDQELPLVEI